MKTRALTFLCAGTLLLSGCGGSEQNTADPSASSQASATATSSAPAGPPRSPRGNVIKQVGEKAGMLCNSTSGATDCQLTFTLDNVAVRQGCQSVSSSVKSPYAVVFDVTLSTSTSFDPDAYSGLFQDDQWSIIGPDGVTNRGEEVFTSADGCGSDARLPFVLAPGSSYTRTVSLASTSPDGIITYVPTSYYNVVNKNGGWEWGF